MAPSHHVLVSGSSGLIGSALISALQARGCDVVRLIRTPVAGEGQIAWDLARPLPPELICGFDAVVHLAGEPVGSRWTSARKKNIHDSRVVGTRHLCQALAATSQPPRVLISASAIGYYGSRGDEVLREDSSPGEGFLADVCRQWEAATQPATDAGIQTVQLRTGIVLSAHGGALKKMLPPFRIGLGAQMGNGRQWSSWIHIEDLVSAVLHILDAESLAGPVNMVAPAPVRNLEFTRTLAKVLSRPALFRIPVSALRLGFGEMADEVLLAGQRVEPAKLVASGYQFEFATLQNALENILRVPPPGGTSIRA